MYVSIFSMRALTLFALFLVLVVCRFRRVEVVVWRVRDCVCAGLFSVVASIFLFVCAFVGILWIFVTVVLLTFYTIFFSLLLSHLIFIVVVFEANTANLYNCEFDIFISVFFAFFVSISLVQEN